LKLNGQLTGYSPLSRLVELEGLTLGCTGKLALWRSLQHLGESGLKGAEIQELIRRAESQIERLEKMRLEAVTQAMTGPEETPSR
jgi:hypothetical protein